MGGMGFSVGGKKIGGNQRMDFGAGSGAGPLPTDNWGVKIGGDGGGGPGGGGPGGFHWDPKRWGWGNWFEDAGEKMGFGGNQKARDAKNEITGNIEQQHADTQGVLGGMDQSDKDYLTNQSVADARYKKGRDQAASYYTNRLDMLDKAANGQAWDAHNTYYNTIRPQQQTMMDQAAKNAAGAMTLEEAGNVNNSVHQGVRNLYNQEGKGIRNQGIADAGVLSALGAQATAGQLNGMPISGAQLAAVQGQNSRGASEAYARASARADDLRRQGIEAGFRESDRQYQRGQDAQRWHADTVGNFENSYGNYQNQQAGYRQERQGYGADKLGIQKGIAGENYDMDSRYAGMKHDLDYGKSARDLGSINDYYGAKNGLAYGDMAEANADQAGKQGMVIGALGTAAGAAAGYYGGPAAGAAGGGGAGMNAMQGAYYGSSIANNMNNSRQPRGRY